MDGWIDGWIDGWTIVAVADRHLRRGGSHPQRDAPGVHGRHHKRQAGGRVLHGKPVDIVCF